MKKLILVLSIIFILTGCSSKKIVPWQKEISESESSKSESEQKVSAHIIPEKTKKEIIKDAYENIKIISQVTTNPSLLKKAMAEEALREMTETVKKDLAAGKIKKRVYAQTKITYQNYTKGIAGLRLEFVDGSYYIDKKTGKPLSEPEDAPRRFALALKKLGKKWKIIRVFSKATTPQR